MKYERLRFSDWFRAQIVEYFSTLEKSPFLEFNLFFITLIYYYSASKYTIYCWYPSTLFNIYSFKDR